MGLMGDERRAVQSTAAAAAPARPLPQTLSTAVLGPGVRREETIDAYERELRRAQLWARTIGLLHSLSRFLALCNLTWATVVLLGAFAASLNRTDFSFVVSLLLVQAARLASASFFSRLLTRTLSRLSQTPLVTRHSFDGQYAVAHLVRLVWHACHVLCVSPTLILPLLALFYRSSTYPNAGGTQNLQLSLGIFYSVMIANSLVGITQLVSTAVAMVIFGRTSEQSILRYFDKVVENAISGGVVQADEFEFFSFAYNMLAGEFRRNVQAEAVARNHKALVRYLYANRAGMDCLLSFLDADDVMLRIAAANIVGFWADRAWGVGWEDGELTLPEEVLNKLAEKVGTTQVGWAAVSSVGALAGRPGGAQLILKARAKNGQSLADRLVDIMDSGSRALSIVRTLVVLYEQLSRDEQKPPSADFMRPAEPKLRGLAAGAKRHRLRVQAAYLLHIMRCDIEEHVIVDIRPKEDSYWFQSEKRMLQLLRDYVGVAPLADDDYPTKLREDVDICPPLWVYDNPNFPKCVP